MPSPFPGMDPYLEGARWLAFHHQFVSEIARHLAPKLRPKYIALTTERVVVEMPELAGGDESESHYPDIGITPWGRGGALAAPATAPQVPLELLTVAPERVPHGSVEIRDVADESLVTAIEVLSPTNKRGGDGRQEYLERPARYLRSPAHLVEIDLLRTGHCPPMRQSLPDAPYSIFVGRSERRPVTQVWPILLDQPLPAVPIPLLAGDPDVTLDLQAAFAAVYDAVGYDLVLRYDRPPEVTLTPPQQEWARGVLRR